MDRTNRLHATGQQALILCCLALLTGCETAKISPGTTQEETVQVAQNDRAASPHRFRDDEIASETIREQSWQAYFLFGSKIGYGRQVEFEVKSPAGMRIRTQLEQVLSIKRYNQITEQTIYAASERTKDGQLLSLDSEYAAGSMSMKSQGTLNDGVLKLTTATQGKRDTQSLPFEGALGYFGLEESLQAQPLQPGETRQIEWLQPVVHITTQEQLTAADYEEVDLLGEKRRLLRIESQMKLGKQTIARSLWTDEAGRVWKVATPATGEENYRTTEKLAKAPSDGAFDLGLATIVKVAEPLEKPHETTRVVYRAKLKHGNPADLFPTGASQAVKAIDESTAEIIVERVTATAPEKIEPPSLAPSAGDKSPNNLIQSDDPAVLRLAAELSAGNTDPTAIALALERGVHEKLTNKNFSQAFSSAADVAQTLEGDCTEHAVLLAALCRARKIPARIAAGLVYYPREQGFAYHMWSEAWLNERWVPLDATLGRGGIGGAHVKLLDSDLSGVSPFAAFLPVMNVLGQLELEIVEANDE